MAWYKYDKYLQKSSGDAYDSDHSPGTSVPNSGIYRCMGCNREVTSNKGDPFPPQNHHQHNGTQGTIRWRLIVYADHNPK